MGRDNWAKALSQLNPRFQPSKRWAKHQLRSFPRDSETIGNTHSILIRPTYGPGRNVHQRMKHKRRSNQNRFNSIDLTLYEERTLSWRQSHNQIDFSSPQFIQLIQNTVSEINGSSNDIKVKDTFMGKSISNLHNLSIRFIISHIRR